MALTNEVSGFSGPQVASESERLRLIEACVTDYAIFTLSAQGYFTSWNVGAQRILGYAAAEALGQSEAIIFTSEDREQGAPAQERQQACATGRADDDRWHVRQDGSRFWASGILTALHTEAGVLRGYVKILRDQTQQHQAETHRAADQARLVEHERHAATMRERTRIAQELHDTLAQGLTGIVLQLSLAEDVLDEDPAQTRVRIHRAYDIARESLAEARCAVQALRPERLQATDLPTALFQLAEQITADSGISIAFVKEGTPFPLLPEVENNLYRIAQEAVTNAMRYAHATQVTLMLIYAVNHVQMRIQDNGVGFDPQAPAQEGGFGMTSMRERAEQIEGQWSLVSELGRGTVIEVIVPLT